ncbi:MAG TPA: DUF222 domain-containing protein [Arthrobacter sp.]|nr:DUF222 domain-containing protein [Arthrobacter sp.]
MVPFPEPVPPHGDGAAAVDSGVPAGEQSVLAASGIREQPPVEAVELPPLNAAGVHVWIKDLQTLTARTQGETIDGVRALEELKSAAAAAQARLSAEFEVLERQRQAELGVAKDEQGKGIASQIALARRESPHRGNRDLGFAKALVHEMPHTLQALTNGVISEWRATLLVRETACLSVEDRAEVDRRIAGDVELLEKLSDKALVAEAKKVSYQLDPHSVVNRASKAVSERNVTCRPAPDTMSYLTALVPAAQGVAVLAALTRVANGPRGEDDTRGRGQIMADTLVERVTGQQSADDTDLEIQLVMTDRTLLAGDEEPAFLPGYGMVPAGTARSLAHREDSEATAWVRRLYTTPSAGQLVGMDSRSRFFPKGLSRFITTRDQVCRTPWCDAPIRHTDHIVPRSVDGQTSENNGEGLCEACNYAKEAPGWSVRPVNDFPGHAIDPRGPAGEERHQGRRHTTEITTPAGHTYRSVAPPLPGTKPSTCEDASLHRKRGDAA